MSKLILVSADRDSGKTTALWNLYRQFHAEENNRIGGYISVLGKDEDKSRITLKELQSDEELLLASSRKEDWEELEEGYFQMGRRYTFFQSVFNRACGFFRDSLDYSHLFLDEAGALELRGSGFAPAIEFLRKNYGGTLIIAVRELFLEDFLMMYHFEPEWPVQILKL